MRLIDADALKENAREWLPEIAAHKNPFVVMGLFNFIDNLADNMPTIDPVKHGTWIAEKYCDGTVRTECSVCGYGRGLPPVRNYCPNCGARMEGEE